MKQPQRMTKAQMLSENRARIARVCLECARDIENGVPEGALMTTIGFLETLIRRRRRIKGGYAECGSETIESGTD